MGAVELPGRSGMQDAPGSGERIGWRTSGTEEVRPLPSTVLCWGTGSTWRTLRVEEHTSSSGRLPRGSFTGHVLALNVGPPYRFGIAWSGESQSVDRLHPPGTFLFLPARRLLSAVWEGPATVLLVEISGFSVSFDAARFEPVLDGHDGFVTHLLLAIRDLAHSRSASGAEYGDSLCAVLMEHLRRSSSDWRGERVKDGQVLSSTRLRRVLEYVEAHLDEGISLSALAHESGTSPFHFSRLFKRRTGLAPHQFIIQKRMERARSLLSDADLSINEVAFRCGFSQQSHFTSTFRRTVGVSPSAYRRLF
jgi:AraC family transcriptional regulator